MKIYNWSTKWLVDFKPQKTKCMLFSTNQGNIKPQILFNNEDVEFVVNHKHLGVHPTVHTHTLIMALN
jgi:hypothetical protein